MDILIILVLTVGFLYLVYRWNDISAWLKEGQAVRRNWSRKADCPEDDPEFMRWMKRRF